MNSYRLKTFAAALALTLGSGALAAPLAAAPAQMTFASPDEAVAALKAAVEVHNTEALKSIFGPGIKDLMTGDEKQDRANSRRFADALVEGATPVPDGDIHEILEIGLNKWPFPIPLVKESAGWRFDTDAGKDEIINRHVGKDELHAIALCRAYLPAPKGGGPDAGAAARAKVLAADPRLAAPKPFHGYYFKVLTRQGSTALGGAADYVKDGGIAGGFALAAYPEHWGRSGVMTFVVNQDGNLYQRDLGEKTADLAKGLVEYNPDKDWTPVKDLGVQEK